MHKQKHYLMFKIFFAKAKQKLILGLLEHEVQTAMRKWMIVKLVNEDIQFCLGRFLVRSYKFSKLLRPG